jgi:hypothetical protein
MRLHCRHFFQPVSCVSFQSLVAKLVPSWLLPSTGPKATRVTVQPQGSATVTWQAVPYHTG